ncbi:hypothetical protein [Salinicola lusitanus]|uniref:hypothetical protein n=1 Tax=Salinicola lusitanus TaxID=1949085 RepID=UPI000DA1B847|nr:hypothetical protein [Salinicola lusitanus]
MAAKYQKNVIPLGPNKSVEIFATPKVSEAFEQVTEDMTLVKGVKLAQVIEAAYNQGKKDGARETFEAITTGLDDAKRAIPHKNPGKPKGTKKIAKPSSVKAKEAKAKSPSPAKAAKKPATKKAPTK